MVAIIDDWNAFYPNVESIADEGETIDAIRNSPAVRAAVAKHVEKIAELLPTLSADVSEYYRPWVLDPESYNFGPEAFYQLRILGTIRNLQDTKFKTSGKDEIICARQILNPSAFNGSPRIKRLQNGAFIIFPAPTIYWMYAIFETIAACMGHGEIDRPRLREYINYLIAARTFQRWANPNTADGLDYLVDEIVHRGKKARSDSEVMREIPSLSVNLVSAAEEFIICHELSHYALGHESGDDIEIEAAADRRAIQMMLSIDPQLFMRVECANITPDVIPLLGYLALRLWTNVRLAAEMKVLPFVYDAEADIAGQKREIDRVFSERQEKLKRVGLLNSLPTMPILKAIVDGAGQAVKEVLSIKIERNEIADMCRLAKSLALGDYGPLGPHLFSDVKAKRPQ